MFWCGFERMTEEVDFLYVFEKLVEEVTFI